MTSIRRAKRPIDDGLSGWSRRRVLSLTLFGLAGVVAAQHLLAHGDWRPIPLTMGWQDILIGYPTAILLVIAGGIAIDPNPRI